MFSNIDNKKFHYVGQITKCEKKKCKKTDKKQRKENSRYTRALHKKCDKKENVFAQCRETVDRSKMNASEDANTQCIHKKCKKELRKSKRFSRHLKKCMRGF